MGRYRSCSCGKCKSCVELASYNQTNRTIVTGVEGLSAYEIWLQQGNEGTIEDFLNAQGAHPVYTLTEW